MRWPTAYTTPSSLARHCRAVFRSCARHSALDPGQKLHAAAITAGLLTHPSLYLRNVIMHMYAACGYVSSARKLFDEIPLTHKDTADWTTLMDCHGRAGSSTDAINLFVVMWRYGVSIDDITIVSLLSTCAKVGNSEFGVQGHACMIKLGLNYCVKARNSAMDMYVKCGLIGDAKTLFDEMNVRNVVSWTVLLWGVVKWEGLEKGQNVFDEMPERNEIAWTIMISRYVENGFIKEAFRLLTEMMFGFGLHLNSSSLCSLLSACTQSGDVVMGKWAHSYALKATLGNNNTFADVKLGTSLLDMYAKCGRINNAIKVFNTMTTRNVVTWNAMLGGLAMHGKGAMVLNILDKMSEEIKPNDVTFTAVLSACSHSGLVDAGRKIFYALENNAYGVKPSMENYACVVDLLGRSGRLEEAEDIIRRMPMRPNEVVLGSLLGACNAHRQHELGDRVVRDLARMYPHNTDHHVLLSNMYALSGKPDKAYSLRRDLRDRGIRKVPGISTMYIDGQVHRFSAGDKSHPRIDEIYYMLDEMIPKLKLAGYAPDLTSQILSGGGDDDDINVQEEKERALVSHSEKLAVCFGLISTKAGTPLYIFKNLRICRDCHSAMKIVSEVYDREIVIRDRNRFHSFKDGFCSCFDFW
ncbi:pentatricopeptide repeat-containing protein at5g15340 mitochondrial [Phtheirospermum japonicum]|uniref:Pentatricopeptide repeat-containing protein at5g15340 mitochondrial n=1 Tax=Phtheirospermum japonicum TaxID=374723 RepID=A0A830D5P1_9LAMI|nr:pentatricopeptide repeat-containing protein at5g15340 mitochondrial [Phtheirospermum japonicum]